VPESAEVQKTTQIRGTTADELLQIPDDSIRYELVCREIYQMAPA